MMILRTSLLLISTLFTPALATIGANACVSFDSTGGGFRIAGKGASPQIWTDPTDSNSVFRAVQDFVSDIQKVTGTTLKVSNYTASSKVTGTPIIVGTLGTPLLSAVVNATKFDTSNVAGQWESFRAMTVSKPLSGVSQAYVIAGSDRRGVIYALYELSEQAGVSPWYWWADVPIQKHSAIYALKCEHGAPTVKYRGLFFNDEQPALQNWAAEKFNNNSAAVPFNHFFYANLFELLLRLKVNYVWPAMWSGMFAVDDPLNQGIAMYYGIVMGTSHQEPMMRSTPNEFNKFFPGQAYDWYVNKANLTTYMEQGIVRAKPYENIITVGMRGSGDEPLTANTNIPLLEDIISTQTSILQQVYNNSDVSDIPQMWCLYKEVLGYYQAGMTVPDYITLMWTDDNWGNILRLPLANETSRAGGAGVYYHYDYVGSPRDYKWITSTQIEKVHEQMSLAVDREATRIWVLNVGDLKPYEMSAEFFITYGWDATKWNPNNLNTFRSKWATREFNVPAKSDEIATIVYNVTHFNARRKPELLNSTIYSLIDYHEADQVLADWTATYAASLAIYNSLPSSTQPAYFELVHHAVWASYNVNKMYISVGKNNLFASQWRISTNDLADQAETLFEEDYTINQEYHTILNGKWDHMMDQTHIGYYYWQQPMGNVLMGVNRVQKNKVPLPGPMRIAIESSAGAWPGDNGNNCAQGYGCPPPTLLTFDPYMPNPSRYIDISLGGPGSFKWNITKSAPWIKVSSSQGSVDRTNPDTTIEVSIDWSAVTTSTVSGSVTVYDTTASFYSPGDYQQVLIVANKTSLPSSFHGHVEGDGSVSIEAPHASSNTSAEGIAWSVLPGYGKTLGAIKPLPDGGTNATRFTAGSGPSIAYNFYTFNSVSTMTTYVAPSMNAMGNDRQLAFAVQIDSNPAQTVTPIPIATPGGLPAGWDTPDGFVANSIVSVVTNHTGVGPGAHTLKVWMIEPAVVIEKFVINTGNVRKSYLGPPESLIV
ncbi:hypothetical protein FRB95_005930 [Tulasnella sp. JGI-2019a]|nr:hypothetical protein FRB95_005930 [Tulasnella sp. JGI-2019a]